MEGDTDSIKRIGEERKGKVTLSMLDMDLDSLQFLGCAMKVASTDTKEEKEYLRRLLNGHDVSDKDVMLHPSGNTPSLLWTATAGFSSLSQRKRTCSTPSTQCPLAV